MIVKKKVFTDEKVKGEDFENITFISCKFIDINIKFTCFLRCKFQSCSFSGSVFESSSFSNCAFPDTNLGNLDFSEIDIKECDFKNAILENTIFQKLNSAKTGERKPLDLTSNKFEEANLSGSLFVMCNLKKVSFIGSNLNGVIFEKCNLSEADMTDTNINGVNFESSNTKGTYLDMNGFLAYGTSKGFLLR